MKSSQKINNIHDLKAEIARLNLRRKEQEAYLTDQYELLKVKIATPFRFFQRITSHIPGAGMHKGFTSGVAKAVQSKDADWLTRALQLGARIVLNSTVLNKARRVKKEIVFLASEAARGRLNHGKISVLLNKGTSYISLRKKEKNKKLAEDTIEKIAVKEHQSPLLE